MTSFSLLVLWFTFWWSPASVWNPHNPTASIFLASAADAEEIISDDEKLDPAAQFRHKGDSGPPHQEEGVVLLDDDNFEHLTQASTGQTTGSWLIWFHTDSDKTTMGGTMPPVDQWLENFHTTVAAVNAMSGGMSTFRRFKIKRIPSFLFIHRGKVYHIPKPAKGGYHWDKLVEFVQNPDPELAQDVPPVPSMFTGIWETLQKDRKKYANVFLIIFVSMVLGLGLLIFIFQMAGAKTTEKKEQ